MSGGNQSAGGQVGQRQLASRGPNSPFSSLTNPYGIQYGSDQWNQLQTQLMNPSNPTLPPPQGYNYIPNMNYNPQDATTNPWDLVIGGGTGDNGGGNRPPNPMASGSGNPNDILSGIPFWQGPYVAGISPNEQQILDDMMAMRDGGNRDLQNSTLADIMGGRSMRWNWENNPFLSGAISSAQRTTRENLAETLETSLPGRFTSAGHIVSPEGSGAFDRAAALAAGRASQSMADIATNMSSTSFEADRQRQFQTMLANQQNRLQAVGLQGSLNQQEVASMIANLQAQSLPRMIEDQGIQRGMAAFQQRVNTLMQTLGIAAGVPVVSLGQAGQGSGSSSQSGFNFGAPGGK